MVKNQKQEKKGGGNDFKEGSIEKMARVRLRLDHAWAGSVVRADGGDCGGRFKVDGLVLRVGKNFGHSGRFVSQQRIDGFKRY